jgi:hypothetical protein
MESLRKMAEYYVATGEDLAREAVVVQRQMAGRTKDISPLFEEQANVTREFVERSTGVARRLLQVQMERGKETARDVREQIIQPFWEGGE